MTLIVVLATKPKNVSKAKKGYLMRIIIKQPQCYTKMLTDIIASKISIARE